LERYTNEQRLGMKTGRGFMEWTPESAQQVRDRLTRHLRDAICEEESFSNGTFENKA
jgi:3-hydroxyacyl-CoA dehydrogenase